MSNNNSDIEKCLNYWRKSIGFKFEGFTLENYDPYPTIKAAVAV
ncbi:MAG: hypothetical protein ACKVOA_10460 [Methylophilaceae bacterium]